MAVRAPIYTGDNCIVLLRLRAVDTCASDFLSVIVIAYEPLPVQVVFEVRQKSERRDREKRGNFAPVCVKYRTFE